MFLVFTSVGTYSVLDPMFAMWVIASMAFSFRALKAEKCENQNNLRCLLGLACGMGFMTKRLPCAGDPGGGYAAG